MSELFMTWDTEVKQIFMAIDVEDIDPVFLGAYYDYVSFTNYQMQVQAIGVGIEPTTVHASPMYAPDFEGVMREYGVDEPVWQDGRKVTNEILWSEDLTNGIWAASSGAVIIDENTFTANAYGGRITQNNVLLPDGASVSYSVDFKTDVDTFVRIVLADDAGNNWLISHPSVGGVRQRAYFDPTVDTSVTGKVSASLRAEETKDVTFTVYGQQIEVTSGRSDTTTPSEYIPTTTVPVTQVYANANGNTVLDNVVTEGTGALLDPQPMLVSQDEATNSLLWSSDLTQPIWTHVGSTPPARDEVGITGQPNTATTVTDSNAGGFDDFNQSIDIDAATTDVTVRVFIKKDSDTSRYPGLHLYYINGTSNSQGNNFNTMTGVSSNETTGIITKVEEYNDWWVLYAQTTNDGLNNTRLFTKIWPAVGNTSGTQDTSAQGSCVIGNFETFLNSTIEDVENIYPIITEGTAVTTQVVNTFDSANYSDSEGPLALTFDYPAEADTDVLSLTEGAYLKVEDGGIGNELITGGTFDQPCGVDWTCDTGWTISGNAANTLNSPHGSDLSNPTLLGTVSGTNYILSFEIFNYTSGGLTIYFDGTSPSISGTKYSGAGIYNLPFEAVGDSTFRLQADAIGWGATDFDMRNISIKEAAKVLALTDQTNSVSLPMPAAPTEINAAVLYEDGGVGNELVTNGTFDDNTDGWATFNATKSYVNNACQIDSTAVFGYLRSAIACPTEAGVEYHYKVDVLDTDATGSFYMSVGTSIGGSDLANINTGNISLGTRSVTFTATSTTSYIQAGVNGNGKYTTMDNISVKEVIPGKMQLKLNDTYSIETTFDNSFGSGALTVGATAREIKRWDRTTIAEQKELL